MLGEVGAFKEMSMLRLRYAVAQRTAKVDESTKAKLRELEVAARRENAAGQTGLVFRDLNKGIAMLQGKPWTATEEFTTSRFLTTDTTVCDPGQPLAVRIAQYYPRNREVWPTERRGNAWDARWSTICRTQSPGPAAWHLLFHRTGG